ncbi:hypothetical protein RKE30_19405 [Streptomyces sp. Li-HN-5-11]|nr:hypothetical protein [Streptomyces sp. Li-HN-5-11]WNM32426.1 hypothetical protein RKE30_19405 [Streptomyces sp. Li-HN-5-11]
MPLLGLHEDAGRVVVSDEDREVAQPYAAPPLGRRRPGTISRTVSRCSR